MEREQPTMTLQEIRDSVRSHKRPSRARQRLTAGAVAVVSFATLSGSTPLDARNSQRSGYEASKDITPGVEASIIAHPRAFQKLVIQPDKVREAFTDFRAVATAIGKADILPEALQNNTQLAESFRATAIVERTQKGEVRTGTVYEYAYGENDASRIRVSVSGDGEKQILRVQDRVVEIARPVLSRHDIPQATTDAENAAQALEFARQSRDVVSQKSEAKDILGLVSLAEETKSRMRDSAFKEQTSDALDASKALVIRSLLPRVKTTDDVSLIDALYHVDYANVKGTVDARLKSAALQAALDNKAPIAFALADCMIDVVEKEVTASDIGQYTRTPDQSRSVLREEIADAQEYIDKREGEFEQKIENLQTSSYTISLKRG